MQFFGESHTIYDSSSEYERHVRVIPQYLNDDLVGDNHCEGVIS